MKCVSSYIVCSRSSQPIFTCSPVVFVHCIAPFFHTHLIFDFIPYLFWNVSAIHTLSHWKIGFFSFKSKFNFICTHFNTQYKISFRLLNSTIWNMNNGKYNLFGSLSGRSIQLWSKSNASHCVHRFGSFWWFWCGCTPISKSFLFYSYYRLWTVYSSQESSLSGKLKINRWRNRIWIGNRNFSILY